MVHILGQLELGDAALTAGRGRASRADLCHAHTTSPLWLRIGWKR
jgi:hypothetical protein